jgi:glycine cleavage system H protein
MSKVIDGLLYSESHEWVKIDGDIAVIGVTDFAQKEMGDITYVDMPESDDEVCKGEDFGALESVKASSDLYSPVSGTVIENNEALADAPELINKDAFTNWIIRVKMKDMSEVSDLMDSKAYSDFIEKQ